MSTQAALTPIRPLDAWRADHRQALEEVNRLESALLKEQWDRADQAARWMYAELLAHNDAEEQELFPILEARGHGDLAARLGGEHRHIRACVLELLAAIVDGRAAQPRAVQKLGAQLVGSLRAHLDTEDHHLHPVIGHHLSEPGRDPAGAEGYEILDKVSLGPETWMLTVKAPMVALGRQPGQFLMLAPFPQSERIPLTLADGDAAAGTIRFVVQEVGATTKAIGRMVKGERLYAVAGPMGHPTPLAEAGTVILVAGGYGSAAILPSAKVMTARGQKVITILGGRSRERVLLADELEAASTQLIVTTDDGSMGEQGLVIDPLRRILAAEPVAQVIAVGPVPMMKAVSDLTKPLAVPTLVSLNALMVDGTGMCGACRVAVGGQVRFACFDGPDFDGHLVDYEQLRLRQSWYRTEERAALDRQDACAVSTHVPLAPPGVAAGPEGWQAMDLKTVKPSIRFKIPRQEMPCQEAPVRITNFGEVALGLTPEQAKLEAARCIDCKKPYCVDGCPVHIDIPGFIMRILDDDPLGAAHIRELGSGAPGACGRFCPQGQQCEKVCVVGIKGDSVAIGRLERYAADAQRVAGIPMPEVAPATGKRTAVVGAGPAGLTVAGDLRRLGHEVTVYDALDKPGGVLLYGIPEFRLPNAIVDEEVMVLRDMGVKFVMNTLVGRSISLARLREEHDAVFMGTGAGLPRMLDVEGEHLKGVYTANEFLTRVNLMRADLFPNHTTPVTVGRRVVVVGCGDTAMDASRTSLRLGPDRVDIVYRRTRKESTARDEEVEHAEQEGIVFNWLQTPVRILGNAEGWVTGVECAVMEVTEPGADGRRGVKMTDARVVIPCDTVITALGFGVNPLLPSTEKRLETKKGGVGIANPDTGETTMPGVFAGGDVITGGATVILAMGQGRTAAAAMHAQMMGLPMPAAPAPVHSGPVVH